MNERRDDTTKPEPESRPLGRAPGGYYYDDATGYETYRPGDDDEGPEDEGSEDRAPAPPAKPCG